MFQGAVSAWQSGAIRHDVRVVPQGRKLRERSDPSSAIRRTGRKDSTATPAGFAGAHG